MIYNKNKFIKTNDKKVLHKVKKHWLVVSVALLGAIGAGGMAGDVSANAATQPANHSNVQNNHSNVVNQANSNLDHNQAQVNHTNVVPNQRPTTLSQFADQHQNNRAAMNVVANAQNIVASTKGSLNAHQANSNVVAGSNSGSTSADRQVASNSNNVNSPRVQAPMNGQNSTQNRNVNHKDQTNNPFSRLDAQYNQGVNSLNLTMRLNQARGQFLNYQRLTDPADSNKIANDYNYGLLTSFQKLDSGDRLLLNLAKADSDPTIDSNDPASAHFSFDKGNGTLTLHDGSLNSADLNFHNSTLTNAISGNPVNSIVTNNVSLDAHPVNLFSASNNSAFANVSKIDVGGLTGNPEDLTGLFEGDSKLTEVDGLDNLNLKSVYSLSYMFANDPKLVSLNSTDKNKLGENELGTNFKNWGTATSGDNKDTASGMFSGDTGLTSMDLSNFNVDNGNMTSMFDGDTNLQKVINLGKTSTNDLSSTASNADLSDMFHDDPNLTDVDLGSFTATNVQNLSSMFASDPKLRTIDNFSNLDLSNVTNLTDTFDGDTSLNLTLPTIGTDSNGGYALTNLSGTFSHMGNAAANLNNLDGINTGNVTDMSNTFANDENNDIPSAIDDWDTSNVSNMSDMFANDYGPKGGKSSIPKLTFSSNFDMSNISSSIKLIDGKFISGDNDMFSGDNVHEMDINTHNLKLDNHAGLHSDTPLISSNNVVPSVSDQVTNSKWQSPDDVTPSINDLTNLEDGGDHYGDWKAQQYESINFINPNGSSIGLPSEVLTVPYTPSYTGIRQADLTALQNTPYQLAVYSPVLHNYYGAPNGSVPYGQTNIHAYTGGLKPYQGTIALNKYSGVPIILYDTHPMSVDQTNLPTSDSIYKVSGGPGSYSVGNKPTASNASFSISSAYSGDNSFTASNLSYLPGYNGSVESGTDLHIDITPTKQGNSYAYTWRKNGQISTKKGGSVESKIPWLMQHLNSPQLRADAKKNHMSLIKYADEQYLEYKIQNTGSYAPSIAYYPNSSIASEASSDASESYTNMSNTTMSEITADSSNASNASQSGSEAGASANYYSASASTWAQAEPNRFNQSVYNVESSAASQISHNNSVMHTDVSNLNADYAKASDYFNDAQAQNSDVGVNSQSVSNNTASNTANTSAGLSNANQAASDAVANDSSVINDSSLAAAELKNAKTLSDEIVQLSGSSNGSSGNTWQASVDASSAAQAEDSKQAKGSSAASSSANSASSSASNDSGSISSASSDASKANDDVSGDSASASDAQNLVKSLNSNINSLFSSGIDSDTAVSEAKATINSAYGSVKTEVNTINTSYSDLKTQSTAISNASSTAHNIVNDINTDITKINTDLANESNDNKNHDTPDAITANNSANQLATAASSEAASLRNNILPTVSQASTAITHDVHTADTNKNQIMTSLGDALSAESSAMNTNSLSYSNVAFNNSNSADTDSSAAAQAFTDASSTASAIYSNVSDADRTNGNVSEVVSGIVSVASAHAGNTSLSSLARDAKAQSTRASTDAQKALAASAQATKYASSASDYAKDAYNQSSAANLDQRLASAATNSESSYASVSNSNDSADSANSQDVLASSYAALVLSAASAAKADSFSAESYSNLAIGQSNSASDDNGDASKASVQASSDSQSAIDNNNTSNKSSASSESSSASSSSNDVKTYSNDVSANSNLAQTSSAAVQAGDQALTSISAALDSLVSGSSLSNNGINGSFSDKAQSIIAASNDVAIEKHGADQDVASISSEINNDKTGITHESAVANLASEHASEDMYLINSMSGIISNDDANTLSAENNNDTYDVNQDQADASSALSNETKESNDMAQQSTTAKSASSVVNADLNGDKSNHGIKAYSADLKALLHAGIDSAYDTASSMGHQYSSVAGQNSSTASHAYTSASLSDASLDSMVSGKGSLLSIVDQAIKNSSIADSDAKNAEALANANPNDNKLGADATKASNEASSADANASDAESQSSSAQTASSQADVDTASAKALNAQANSASSCAQSASSAMKSDASKGSNAASAAKEDIIASQAASIAISANTVAASLSGDIDKLSKAVNGNYQQAKKDSTSASQHAGNAAKSLNNANKENMGSNTASNTAASKASKSAHDSSSAADSNSASVSNAMNSISAAVVSITDVNEYQDGQNSLSNVNSLSSAVYSMSMSDSNNPEIASLSSEVDSDSQIVSDDLDSATDDLSSSEAIVSEASSATSDAKIQSSIAHQASSDVSSEVASANGFLKAGNNASATSVENNASSEVQTAQTAASQASNDSNSASEANQSAIALQSSIDVLEDDALYRFDNDRDNDLAIAEYNITDYRYCGSLASYDASNEMNNANSNSTDLHDAATKVAQDFNQINALSEGVADVEPGAINVDPVVVTQDQSEISADSKMASSLATDAIDVVRSGSDSMNGTDHISNAANDLTKIRGDQNMLNNYYRAARNAIDQNDYQTADEFEDRARSVIDSINYLHDDLEDNVNEVNFDAIRVENDKFEINDLYDHVKAASSVLNPAKA